MSTTTIRLPDALKSRVAAAAKRAGTTAHGFILDAIAEKAESAERRAINDKRELVIGRDSHGYMALYRHVERIDTVFVLAVRAQREAGFAR